MKKLVVISMIFCLMVGFTVAADFGTYYKPDTYKKVNYPRYYPKPVEITQTPTTTPTVIPTCPTIEPTVEPTVEPTCEPTPEPTPDMNITIPEQVVPESVAYYYYDVMVLDGIDIDMVHTALCYVPNMFNFKFVAEDPSQYNFDKNGYAVPQRDRLITVFNGTAHGYDGGPVGYYYGNGRITAMYLGQDPYKLSWIITHECLHEPMKNSEVNQDRLQEYKDSWNMWMGNLGLGFWSGGEDMYIAQGWNRLQQDYLVYEALKVV